jgi:hypothetical protein
MFDGGWLLLPAKCEPDVVPLRLRVGLLLLLCLMG